MQWADEAEHYLQALKPTQPDAYKLQRVLRLIDFTRLQDTDTEAAMTGFLQKAHDFIEPVAAVCVYSPYVKLARVELKERSIPVATVVNFPLGQAKLETVLLEIGRALQEGAQEIDVVFPYQRYLQGEREYARAFISACKAACGEKVKLKAILETGALIQPKVIAAASQDVLEAGADFIKTSTGKIATGATLPAAAVMLLVIREMSLSHRSSLGIKVAGGIRQWEQAWAYLALADDIMGPGWATSSTFRIGASQLFDELAALYLESVG